MEIKKIIKLANEEKWIFPKTYAALKEAGVTKYDVATSNLDTTYFKGSEVVYVKESEFKKKFKVTLPFSKQGIEDVIKHHQINRTSYFEFMEGIASHGCDHYTVDMEKDECIYFDKEETQSHIEKIK